MAEVIKKEIKSNENTDEKRMFSYPMCRKTPCLDVRSVN